jgi:S-formylglutathione hydrolase
MTQRNRLLTIVALYLICLMLVLICAGIGVAQTGKGQQILRAIPAPSLQNNLLGDGTKQAVVIYLPPSYGTGDKSYPAVYFLPGFGDAVRSFVDGTYQGFRLQETMDRLINTETIKEMIVVIANGRNFLGGSFYVNSPVTGNWEDFIVKDVVGYVDSHYRTIKDARSRGISGHSMGGFGALNIAMRHPDVFSCVYALSPGLFDQNGLSNTPMFSQRDAINRYLTTDSSLASVTNQEAKTKFSSMIAELYHNDNWDQLFTYAYGSAFSPNPNKNAPYISYPYKKTSDSVIRDSTTWKAWENGFGGITHKMELYITGLSKLHAISIEFGRSDENPWIPQGCQFFSQQLKKEGISHKLVTFNGGHQDKLRQRLEEYMLPFFSKNLASE